MMFSGLSDLIFKCKKKAEEREEKNKTVLSVYTVFKITIFFISRVDFIQILLYQKEMVDFDHQYNFIISVSNVLLGLI